MFVMTVAGPIFIPKKRSEIGLIVNISQLSQRVWMKSDAFSPRMKLVVVIVDSIKGFRRNRELGRKRG
jgi:hypothetical protein